MKLLSLGAIAMDIVLDSHELPRNDGFSLINQEKMLPGGSASNVSVCAGQLGMEAFQTGQIGEDEIGRQFRLTLEADGVDDRYVITKPGGSTLHTYIITAPGGDHCIFANLGDAVATLDVSSLPDSIAEEMDVFYTDMFSSNASIVLARKFRALGKPVIYNMQCTPSFMSLCGTTMEQIEEMIRLSTIFTSGRDGYKEMTGLDDYHESMKVVAEKYHPSDGVVCTAGNKGASWLPPTGEEIVAPACHIEAVDTTGAGDCFIGGLIYAYVQEKMSRAHALEFANTVAALKCTQHGPRIHTNPQGIQDFKSSLNK